MLSGRVQSLLNLIDLSTAILALSRQNIMMLPVEGCISNRRIVCQID